MEMRDKIIKIIVLNGFQMVSMSIKPEEGAGGRIEREEEAGGRIECD